MKTANTHRLNLATSCDIHFDDLTRQLYATDASIYQLIPLGVAFPKTSYETSDVMRAALNENVDIIPRGAGTGLAGGALGEGLIVDLARYNNKISNLNLEARTVRVGAGVVLDQLNSFLAPHGLAFGPDVATSSRATLGGMIANNSSGARTPLYGVTGDHVRSLEVILPSSQIVEVGEGKDGLLDLKNRIDVLIERVESTIQTQLHTGVIKRWPGYGLDRYVRNGKKNLANLFGGSEGTLGAVFSAELNLVPLPEEKGMGLIFFNSVEEAMQATVELLELQPAAIEHIDDVLFDQTRGQLAFKTARDLLLLDELPCKSILIVEFYADVKDKLAVLSSKSIGQRKLIIENPADMAIVLNLRKQGLSLLTSRKGDAKPTAGIEDVAVPPDRLPEYVAGMYHLLTPMGIQASFYGHAASGLLHVRPVLDMHQAEDIKKFRLLAEGVSALTREFKGALAAEHGVGIARTEFMEYQLGPEILDTMRHLKALLDPKNLLNPGKIFSDGRFKIDTHLRLGANYQVELPFEPVLAFAHRDESFVANLEQCNGNGACRKLTPAMCPTYIATGDDLMSTRGRANIIRAVLDGRLGGKHPLRSPELEKALDYCLSCKACKTECPSNVDLSLLKAELQYAKIRKYGIPFHARLLSRVDIAGKLGSLKPSWANSVQEWYWLRKVLKYTIGITTRRPLPAFSPYTYKKWHETYSLQPKEHRTNFVVSSKKRGQVILWDDTFVQYYDAEIGAAATRILEAAGYEVQHVENHVCCGRPAMSMGRLDLARQMGTHNLKLLKDSDTSIIFLEPSSYSMFKHEYIELKLSGAREVADRSLLFEHFMEQLLVEEPDALVFDDQTIDVAIHVHCHAKALTNSDILVRLANRIPGNTVHYLDAGCCGMAGSYGLMDNKYDLSVEVAQPLLSMINSLKENTYVVASGTSCRHQIAHLTNTTPIHMAELMELRLKKID